MYRRHLKTYSFTDCKDLGIGGSEEAGKRHANPNPVHGDRIPDSLDSVQPWSAGHSISPDLPLQPETVPGRGPHRKDVVHLQLVHLHLRQQEGN